MNCVQTFSTGYLWFAFLCTCVHLFTYPFSVDKTFTSDFIPQGARIWDIAPTIEWEVVPFPTFLEILTLTELYLGQHSQFQTMGTAWNMNLPHNFQVVLYIKISWSSPVPEKSSAGWRCLCCTATFWPALCWEASTSGVLVLMPMSHFGNSTSRQDFPDFLKICWYFLDSWWLLMQSCWGDVCQLCHMLFLCG